MSIAGSENNAKTVMGLQYVNIAGSEYDAGNARDAVFAAPLPPHAKGPTA